MLDDRSQQVLDARWEMIAEQYSARKEAGAKRGAENVYRPVAPDAMFATDPEWQNWLGARRQLRLLGQCRAARSRRVWMPAAGSVAIFAPERQSEQLDLFGALAAHLK